LRVTSRGLGDVYKRQVKACAWMISTDAGKDVCVPTITEVYKEMARLRNELVEPDELKLVKNYMLGGLLGDLDGPFQIMARWKTYILNGLTDAYFYNTIDVVRHIQAPQLQDLAQTYLQEDDFYELVVY
jgi:zinc protease